MVGIFNETCYFCLLKFLSLHHINCEWANTATTLNKMSNKLLLLLLPPLLYHTGNTTKLQMICNNYSLFFLFSFVSCCVGFWRAEKDQLKAAARKNSTKRVTVLMKNIPEMSKKLLFFFCHSAVSGKCPTNSSLSHAPLSPLSVFQDLLLKLQNSGSCFLLSVLSGNH